jgi:hypothetical protein
MARILFVILLAGIVSADSLRADEPNPIRKEVDKARATRVKAEDTAKSALVAEFDEAVKTAAGLGDFEGAKTLYAEMRAFLESGKIPMSVKVHIAGTEYEKTIRAAQAALEKAYEQAIKDATKALKIEEAETFRMELKALQPNRTGTGEKVDSPAKGKWVPGTYNVNFPKDGARTYVIHANGQVVEGPFTATLKHFSGSSFVADFGDQKFERLTFVDGRLFVEHFNPKSNFGKNPPTSMAVGDPAKKK